MGTIERRIDLLLRSQAFLTVHAAAGEYAEARIHLAARDTTEAAIVKEWNMAIEAMKAYVDHELVIFEDGLWICNCQHTMQRGHDADCFIPQFQAAISRMEGTDV